MVTQCHIPDVNTPASKPVVRVRLSLVLLPVLEFSNGRYIHIGC